MTSHRKQRVTIEVDDLPGPDFTTYMVQEPQVFDPIPEVNDKQSKIEETEQGKHAHDGSFVIKNPSDPDTMVARGLACRAYAGTYWSVTLRCDAPNKRQPKKEYSKLMEVGFRDYVTRHTSPKCKPQNYLGYCPKGYDKYGSMLPPRAENGSADSTPAEGEVFLNDIYKICLKLFTILKLNPVASPTGLITLTGATDSSKSLITRGLIFLILEAAAENALEKRLRRPHLVTYEDPIEEYYLKDPITHSAPKVLKELNGLLEALYIDYTPREKVTDAESLVNVIRDAKRQTPAVFFVGETRDPNDWRELLDFSGSGHLVITTSHAGSVVEAMTQIFRSTKTRTPSQRSEIARRIRGIINMRSFNPSSPEITSNVRALLPSAWISTSQSINNLVADGLSSILPALGREHEIGYYGRTYFAQELLVTATDKFKDCADKAALEQEIMRQACQWDIEGV
jgi:Tfp pilus assembly pilus retraction ATPase PilT